MTLTFDFVTRWIRFNFIDFVTAGLCHKTLDDTMEQFLAVLTRFHQRNKITYRVRGFVFKKLDVDIASGGRQSHTWQSVFDGFLLSNLQLFKHATMNGIKPVQFGSLLEPQRIQVRFDHRLAHVEGFGIATVLDVMDHDAQQSLDGFRIRFFFQCRETYQAHLFDQLIGLIHHVLVVFGEPNFSTALVEDFESFGEFAAKLRPLGPQTRQIFLGLGLGWSG